MRFEFPLDHKDTPHGSVCYPRLPVTIETEFGAQVYPFLIDTGADFTLAPREFAEQLGLDWESLDAAWIAGIEGRGVAARLGILPTRIADLDLDLRCLFIDRRDTPLILGRADFLDRFVLTIDASRGRIVIEDSDQS